MMKKRISKFGLVLISMLVLMVSSVSIAAPKVAPGPVDPGTGAGCIYQATHGKHNPHASNFEYKCYVTPDYSVGQMLQNSFYACKGCNYCCCIIYEHFGNLITDTSEEMLNK